MPPIFYFKIITRAPGDGRDDPRPGERKEISHTQHNELQPLAQTEGIKKNLDKEKARGYAANAKQ